jgi:hypothetical protein
VAVAVLDRVAVRVAEHRAGREELAETAEHLADEVGQLVLQLPVPMQRKDLSFALIVRPGGLDVENHFVVAENLDEDVGHEAQVALEHDREVDVGAAVPWVRLLRQKSRENLVILHALLPVLLTRVPRALKIALDVRSELAEPLLPGLVVAALGG